MLNPYTYQSPYFNSSYHIPPPQQWSNMIPPPYHFQIPQIIPQDKQINDQTQFVNTKQPYQFIPSTNLLPASGSQSIPNLQNPNEYYYHRPIIFMQNQHLSPQLLYPDQRLFENNGGIQRVSIPLQHTSSQIEMISQKSQAELKDEKGEKELDIYREIVRNLLISESSYGKIQVTLGRDCDYSHFSHFQRIPENKDFVYCTTFSKETQKQSQFFVCTIRSCRKVFRKWQNIFDHLRIHTGEKPYECPLEGCDHRSSQQSNMTKHLNIHQGHRLNCRTCKRVFSNPRLLVKHFISHST